MKKVKELNIEEIEKLKQEIKVLKQQLEEKEQVLEEYKRQLFLGGVSTRYLFKDKQPQIGDYISMYWADGSDCECVYNGLDKRIKPLPIGWYHVYL